MLDFTVAITIDCSPERVWNLLVDVRRWWLRSNPEHESLEVVGPDSRIGPGSELRVRECIAGIRGEAVGTITEFVPGERATWEARARYRLLWADVPIREGVTWSVSPVGRRTRLGAHVWAHFPDGFLAKGLEWLFIHAFRGREKDRRHAALELEFIRSELEKQPAV